MLLLSGLLMSAWAQDEVEPSGRPIELSAGIQVMYGAGSSSGAGGPGHDVRVGLPLSERWLIEAISSSSDGAALEGRAGVRLFLDEPWSDRGALSLTAAPLGFSLQQQGYSAGVGAAYDAPIRRRLVGRVGLEAVTAGGEVGLRASVGLVLPPKDPAPIIRTVYIDRPVAEVAEEIVSAEEMVWVPEPVCDWMPVDEADSMLAEIQAQAQAQASSPKSPESVEVLAASLASEASGGNLPFWAPESVEGALVVIAHPGDKVFIEGEPVTVDEQGVAMLKREEGLVEIEIASGGQRQVLRAGLVPGHAVWVRAGDPDPDAVYFELNSVSLDAAGRASLREVAENVAGWSFVLQGGYSPEGTLEHNRALAIERARAVSHALQAAGVPEDRIVFLDPPRPDPNRTGRQQRNCRIIPVAPTVSASPGGAL